MKKLLLIALVIILVVAVPIIVFLISQQLKPKFLTSAESTLTLSPETQNATVGSDIEFDVGVNPQGNAVSDIDLAISYDTTKLATTSAGIEILPITTATGSTITPRVKSGPEYLDGNIIVSLSYGPEIENSIQSNATIAKVTFQTIEATDTGVSANVKFGTQTQLLSFGSENSPINVLSKANGANVIIEEDTTISGSQNLIPNFSGTSDATESGGVTELAAAPSVTPTEAATLTSEQNSLLESPTPTPTVGGSLPKGLVCSSISADPSTEGYVPYSVSITVIASSDTTTIEKIVYDFGDGQTQEVTDPSGLNANSTSVVASHDYYSAGSFNVIATVYDSLGNTTSENCSIVINVTDSNGAGASGTSSLTPVPSPLEPAGPENLVPLGMFGILAIFAGAFILFLLNLSPKHRK